MTHCWVCLAGTNYLETLRVQIHANCRIRRIYFSDRLYSEGKRIIATVGNSSCVHA